MNIRVNGNTIKSLRERYKADLKQASYITGIEENVLDEWEKNGTDMSLTQAKSYAAKENQNKVVFSFSTYF